MVHGGVVQVGPLHEASFKDETRLFLERHGCLVNLCPANGQGAVRSPLPLEREFIWGPVRRRLREREVKGV
jgi:hypothetical protein